MGKGWITATAIVAFAGGALAPIEPFKAEATTYEDCLLANLSSDMSSGAANLVRSACGRKFRAARPAPATNDTPAIDRHPVWSDVTGSAAFQQGNPETRAMIRQYFLEWVVIPAIPEGTGDLAEKVRVDFTARTQKDIDSG